MERAADVMREWLKSFVTARNKVSEQTDDFAGLQELSRYQTKFFWEKKKELLVKIIFDFIYVSVS